MLANGIANLGFLRDLNQLEQTTFAALQVLLNQFNISPSRDKVSWALESSGNFLVKFTYTKLVPGPIVRYAKAPWAARIPPRVRSFLWQASLDCLPSAINLQKHHDPSNRCCAFSGAPEDANHILFRCAFAIFLWSCVRDCIHAATTISLAVHTRPSAQTCVESFWGLS